MFWIIFFTFFLEFFLVGSVASRDFFGINLQRYQGVIGEFNYTAILLSGLGLIFLISKNYKYSLFAYLMIFLTASRGAFIPLILYVFSLSINFLFGKKVFKFFIWTILIFILAYPIFILIIDSASNADIKKILNDFSSLRYSLHVGYAQMGMENMFGFGYFNGINHINEKNISFRFQCILPHRLSSRSTQSFFACFFRFWILGLLFVLPFFNKYFEKSKFSFFEIASIFCLFYEWFSLP